MHGASVHSVAFLGVLCVKFRKARLAMSAPRSLLRTSHGSLSIGFWLRRLNRKLPLLGGSMKRLLIVAVLVLLTIPALAQQEVPDLQYESVPFLKITPDRNLGEVL